MRRHVIEEAYYVGGARFPPSTVVGSTPHPRTPGLSTGKLTEVSRGCESSMGSMEAMCYWGRAMRSA